MSPALFPSGGVSCQICEKHISYRAGRDVNIEYGQYRCFCSKCQKWVHYWCFVVTEKVCLSCSGPSLNTMKEAVKDLEFGTKEENDTALFVMSAWSIGTNEVELAKFTGLSEEFIRPRAERLRQSKIWTEDGRIIIDESVDTEDPRQLEIVIILHTLCAEGLVACTNKEPDGNSEKVLEGIAAGEGVGEG